MSEQHTGKAPRPWKPWQRGPLPRETAYAFGQRGYLRDVSATFKNGYFAVMVRKIQTAWGTVTHLMITNADGTPTRDWRDLMRIKDEIAGKDRTAVEVYPPRDEVVDQANMMHLWVLPDEMELPFTLYVPPPMNTSRSNGRRFPPRLRSRNAR